MKGMGAGSCVLLPAASPRGLGLRPAAWLRCAALRPLHPYSLCTATRLPPTLLSAVPRPRPPPPLQVNYWLGGLVEVKSADLYRMKGVLAIKDFERRFVFQVRVWCGVWGVGCGCGCGGVSSVCM